MAITLAKSNCSIDKTGSPSYVEDLDIPEYTGCFLLSPSVFRPISSRCRTTFLLLVVWILQAAGDLIGKANALEIDRMEG